jgi:hypothetical protein
MIQGSAFAFLGYIRNRAPYLIFSDKLYIIGSEQGEKPKGYYTEK